MRRYDASIEHEMARVDALWEDQLYEAGHRILEDILANEPGYGKAHAYMGWYAYAKAGDYESAAESYRLAMRFNPGFAGIYPNYTGVLIALNRCEQAVEIALMGMNVGGTDKAHLRAEIGRAYEMRRRLKHARKAYRDAYYLADEDRMMSAMKAAMSRVRRKRLSLVLGVF